jgi:hypothetical protein
VASVLGRITTAEASPRGPDLKHAVRVKHRWLDRGETVEVELPRNLSCALCDGGGCDACGGAGAVSTRERSESPRRVRVTLPARREGVAETGRVALRIPEHGAPADRPGLPRGMLILTVIAADEPDATVRKIHPSLAPPVAVVEPSLAPAPPPSEPTPSRLSWPLVAVVAAAVWVLLLLGLRAFGWI